MLIEMRQEADYVICLEAYERLRAIGWFYEDFTQVTDEQVIAALARSTLATAVKKPAA
jgi:putative phosphoribosyl transferase